MPGHCFDGHWPEGNGQSGSLPVTCNVAQAAKEFAENSLKKCASTCLFRAWEIIQTTYCEAFQGISKYKSSPISFLFWLKIPPEKILCIVLWSGYPHILQHMQNSNSSFNFNVLIIITNASEKFKIICLFPFHSGESNCSSLAKCCVFVWSKLQY